MDVDNVNLNEIYKFTNKKDLDVIKSFLEKKYKKQIFYTLFRENLVLYVNTNKIFDHSPLDKNYTTDPLIIVKNKNIADRIIFFDYLYLPEHSIFFKNLRLDLINGVCYYEDKFEKMVIIDDGKEYTLLKYLLNKNINNDIQLLNEFINKFIDIYTSQKNIINLNYYFNTDYFSTYHNISISKK